MSVKDGFAPFEAEYEQDPWKGMMTEEGDQGLGVAALPASRLRWRCDPAAWPFETTDQVRESVDVLGQERAVEAIRLAVGIGQPGYNIFALGSNGLGKHDLVRRLLAEKAAERKPPDDWCYVNNFHDERRPRAIRLPAGTGRVFQENMARLVEDLRTALTRAFESEEYRTRRQVIEAELQERQQQAVAEVEAAAKARNLVLIRTPMGFAFAPTSGGQVIQPDVFHRLPAATREQIERDMEAMQRQLQDVLQRTPLWLKETGEKIRELNKETARLAVTNLINLLRDAYREQEEVLEYLDEIEADAIGNAELFLKVNPEASDGERGSASDPFRRYMVNLIMSSSEDKPAPVIYEDNPTYDRLLGTIEHRAEMGALLTDFTMIRAGALHRANGGYLILDAHKVLTRPLAWEALKRSLFAREIRLEPLAQALGLLSTMSLEPEPIPLDVKVCLVGERLLYYLLAEYDPEFCNLFKVAADFEEVIDLTPESHLRYAGRIVTLVKRNGLRPFSREAVARVVEHALRLAGDTERLTARSDLISDLLREADHWAQVAGHPTVMAEDVAQAIDKQIYRHDRIRRRLQEEIERGTLLIDTSGAKVGQINGLSVISLGGFSFGRPSRITARVRLGRGEVIDIEREVALGGPLHSKGVLILRGFLAARYVPELPLSLAASLVFEQSYGGVDGDSASSAELYALLSALGELPLRQSLAVTGSVNQHGQVQAIGGVNEKIEGFFDLCAARGLTGEQGVLVPAANVKHLMLREDVVEAVAAGKFHVYPVETIDQGMELLTGCPAGSPDEKGHFPPETVNGRVERRLREMAEQWRGFARMNEKADTA